MKDGFDPSKARTKALGHGINVSADLIELLRYATNHDACIVRYTCASTQMIHEVYDDGSEVFYTKQKYMYPPEVMMHHVIMTSIYSNQVSKLFHFLLLYAKSTKKISL